MEASNSHGGKNITLILFYSQEHPFLFALTCDMVLEAVLCTFLEVGIMGCVSLLFHVRLAAGITGIFLIWILVFLTTFFMAGLAYGISLILLNEVMYKTVMNAIVLPVFFLSTVL